MIQTICYIRTKKGEYIHEKDWVEKLDELILRGVLDVDYLRAKIIISSSIHQCNTLEDTLEPLVQNLCLLGVRSMLAGEDFSFKNWGFEGTISMEIKNENIRLSGNFLTPTLYPKDEIFEALLNCAGKFLRFLRLFKSKDSRYDGSRLGYLETIFAELTALL